MGENQTEIENLFRELYRSMRRESGEVLSQTGLTNSDFLYLKCIAASGGAQASEIADVMGVRRGYVSALSKRMEKLNYVKRTPLKTDGRGFLLEFTREGESLYTAMEKKVGAVNSEKISRIDPDEAVLLKKILKTMLYGESREKESG